MIDIISNGIVIGQIEELKATDKIPDDNAPTAWPYEFPFETGELADWITERVGDDWWISNVEYDYGDSCDFVEVVPMEVESYRVSPLRKTNEIR